MKHPFIVIIILIIVGATMYPLGTAVGKYTTPQNPAEIASLPLGDTVLNGTHVVDNNKIRKVPLLYHPDYLVEYAKNYQFWEIFTSLTTGAAPNLMENVAGSGISDNGVAEGIKGAGMLTVQGNKLIVTNPTFVWLPIFAIRDFVSFFLHRKNYIPFQLVFVSGRLYNPFLNLDDLLSHRRHPKQNTLGLV